MNPASFSLILSGVLLNALAQLLLKAGTNSLGPLQLSWSQLLPLGWQVAREPHILGGMGCYAVSVVIWIVALSRVPVSMAYPMSSIGYVVSAAAAYWLLGEAVSTQRMLGIFVVVLGVILIARS